MRSDTVLPFLAMVVVQIGYTGVSILSKLAMNSGMNPLVLVSYRQLFATLAISPIAFFERKTRPKITKNILFQIFLCSLFGGTMSQTFFFAGLKITSPTISCAIINLLPAVTFILAITFRLEKVGFRTKHGKAKVIGTIVCVGGAMFLSFNRGGGLRFPISKFYLHYPTEMPLDHSSHPPSLSLGLFLLFGCVVSWAAWYIVQARLSKSFYAPYTCSTLMCFMASIECVAMALCFEHNVAAWSLRSNIRLVATLFAAFVGSAIAYCLIFWSIQKKGPLYVSVFSPLMLVLVAVLSWALLREKLYVGTAIGAVLIVCGLYTVLWGKTMETKENACAENEEQQEIQDLGVTVAGCSYNRKKRDVIDSFYI